MYDELAQDFLEQHEVDDIRHGRNPNPKHTPGPWTPVTHYAHIDAKTVTGYSVDADLPSEGLTPEWHKVAGEIETEANAVLIAAAPELLHALRFAREELMNQGELNGWTDCDNITHTLHVVNRALDVAEGR